MKLSQLIIESTLSKMITADDLVHDIQKIHGRPEDFDEGDIIERIMEWNNYKLVNISISKLNLTEWDVDRDHVDELMKSNIQRKYYPVVVSGKGYSIIDGIHRANAVFGNGIKTIKIYKGIKD